MSRKNNSERRFEPRYASVDEASWIASLSRVTIYRLIAAEKLVAVKAGSKTLVEVASLQTYMASLPRFVGRTGTCRKAI